MTLRLTSNTSGGSEQTIYTETFTIPAGGSRPFTGTTVASVEGAIALTAMVTQNSSILAKITDQYEVAAPKITATVTAPDTAGNDPFMASVGLTNSGKTDATVIIGKSFASLPETVTVPAGQSTLLQYTRQITADTTDTYTFSGDFALTITKTVKYGLAGTVALTPQALYPEGKITIPATTANTGLLDGQFSVSYQLTQAGNPVSQQTANYYIAKGGNATDTLTFDLTEGSYQLTAIGQLPATAAMASFYVRKEVKTDLTMTVRAQSGALLPVTVNVTNLGYNPIDGAVRLSLIDANGAVAWSTAQDVSLPQSLIPGPLSLVFSINLSAIKPGNYTIKAELMDNGNRQLAAQTSPFSLLAPTFVITQLPPYQTIPAGGKATFTFRVKNSGNQEGACDLAFKADDLVNSTQTAWLKPGEQKEFAFAFGTAADLEEKEYTAAYSLKKQGAASGEQGVVKYHLAGINLVVTAALDRQNYNVGDTATLTLTITQQDAGAAPNLFARVNYAGYEVKRSFTLTGSQTLTFNVPLSRITGEKLFYGIYFDSGRSIHLNSVYIYKADGVLMVTTDKQVYSPGETVTASVSGTSTGDMTLSGPGDFSNILAFNGAATRSFVLPAAMTAGTYMVNAQLTTQNSGVVTASTPFDVAGIQVKVKEALLDKPKYSSTDSMQLALTVESNLDMPATLKTWVVDPASSYTDAGSSDVTLTAAAPVIVTQNAALAATSTGIHKLVYGIYQGDLLLASGAKAFDIGEAVLLGLATDRTDYPEITSPVTAKADIYGTTDAGLEYFLDGTSIKSDTVTLAGFAGYTLVISPASLTPGRHTLKAVLTSGGLTSVKETSFTCGSSLADLTVRLSSDAVKGNTLNLTATVVNQGKTTAGTTTLALYDGDPGQGATTFASLNVPMLAGGATATLTYNWNVLGKSGDHLIYAVVDPANMVTEFIETNNTALTSVSLPSLALGVSTGGASFRSNMDVGIAVNYANLSPAAPYQDLLLRVALTDPQGVTSVLKEVSITTLAPAAENTDLTVWNTARNLPGNYTINAVLIGGNATLAANSAVFGIEPTLAVAGAITLNNAEIGQGAPLVIAYTINNSGNIETTGVVKALIIDPQNDAIKYAKEEQVNLPLHGSQTGGFTFMTEALDIKSYRVDLQYLSQEKSINIVNASFTVKDTIPPLLTVSTLSDGSYTNNVVLNVAGTATDNIGVNEVTVNGSSVMVTADGGFSHAIILQSGANTVTTVATDIAGNRTSDARTITLDQTAPLLTINSPSDNAKAGSAHLTISGNVDENSTVTIKLGDSIQNAVLTGNTFSADVTLIPGYNTIDITATDLAGNSSSLKRTLIYDDQAPSLAINQPGQDILTRQENLLILGTATDPYGLAVIVRIDMGGETFHPAVINGEFGQSISFSEEKGYKVIVTAASEVGASTTVTRNVIYDITPPGITIDVVESPTNQSKQVITGTMEEGATVTVTCSTATVGVVDYPTPNTWKALIAGLALGKNQLTATSTDAAGNIAAASADIVVITTPSENTFTNAVFGNNGITMSGGSFTDSYVGSSADWTKGEYKNGDVGTNSFDSCAIKLSGGAMIYGDAWVGVGGNPATGICLSGGSSVFNNNTATLPAAKDMTPKTDPVGGTAMGALNLSGHATTTLSAGEYRYTSVKLSGGSTLKLSGGITIHVDGDMTVSGGSILSVTSGPVTIYVNGQKINFSGGSLINSTQDPNNLVIYGTSALQSVNLSGESNQHVLLYAPSAAITLSGGQKTFGSVIGNSVTLSGGSSVHFYEGLNN